MECQQIKALFKQLQKQKKFPFPAVGNIPDVPETQGVYVIRDSAQRVVHVGRTLRGCAGLRQRLNDHLQGRSSFVRNYLIDRTLLRNGYTFQYLPVQDNRQRALLENLTTAWHCPAHLGLGTANAE